MADRRRRRSDVSGLLAALLIASIMIVIMSINFSMRGDCLDAGGIWLMRAWVCVPGNAP